MKRKTGRGLARVALLIGIVMGAGGTAWAQDVSYNALPGADFTKFKTYRWVTIEGAQRPDQITDQQIMQAIDAELARKGLTKTDGDQADLYVGYQVALDKEKRVDSYSTGGMGWGWYGYGNWGMESTHATTSTIHVGTLALDMYAAAAKQLVWRGMASKTLDPKANPEKRQKNIAKAVAKLLKKFPPPPNT
jgi:hypothetical protein